MGETCLQLTDNIVSDLFCRLYLQRDEIDNPHKKKAKAVFKEDFAVELKFEDVKE